MLLVTKPGPRRMIASAKRIGLLIVAALPLIVVSGCAKASRDSEQQPTGPTVTDIKLSYKRDPRLVDPYRGIGPWAPGPNFGGATAQDTVEVRAEGVDAAGRPTKISPKWFPSDPKIVTVSPSQGDDVKITVHRAGESKLQIAYQRLSKELVVRAQYVNKFIVLEIFQPAAVKLDAPPAPESPSALKTKKEQLSYAAGMNLAKALQKQSIEVDEGLVTQGLKDTLSGSKTLLTEEQARAALSGVETDPRIIQENLDRKALAEKNKRDGEAFLAENKKKDGVVTLPNGLQYRIIKAGRGKKPTANDAVTCRYLATFVDGTTFADRRKISVTFPVKSAVQGLAEALQLMPVGSQWQLVVPSDLAYGERGAGVIGGRGRGPKQQLIGPNATLIFELELLSIQEASTIRASGQQLNKPGTVQQKGGLR